MRRKIRVTVLQIGNLILPKIVIPISPHSPEIIAMRVIHTPRTYPLHLVRITKTHRVAGRAEEQS